MAHGNRISGRTARLDASPGDEPSNHPPGHRYATSATIVSGGRRYMVARESQGHGQFHPIQVQGTDAFGWMPITESDGVAYQPIAPGQTLADIEGATWAHDTGTHWEFAHCSPAEHVAFAAEARTFAAAQFALRIAQAQIKALAATNRTARDAAIARLEALVAFAEAVGAEAYRLVLAATLGHFHRHPHHDHRRALTAGSIAAVLAAWKTAALTDAAVRARRAAVTTDAAGVVSSLTTPHVIETRAARAARLAAEAKAAKDAATAGGGETEGE